MLKQPTAEMALISSMHTGYLKLDKLGEGSFGEVYKVMEASTQNIFVCKEMLLDKLEDATIL